MIIEHERLQKLCEKARIMRDTKNSIANDEKPVTEEIRAILPELPALVKGEKWEVGKLLVSLSDVSSTDNKKFVEELLKRGVNGDIIEQAKAAATRVNTGSRLNIDAVKEPKTLMEVFSTPQSFTE